MLLREITESQARYTSLPTRRFRVSGPTTFEELKQHPIMQKHMGPHTDVFDASEVSDVAAAPGENKWNALRRLYGHDEDSVACARTLPSGNEWVCLAINVMV